MDKLVPQLAEISTSCLKI